MTMIAADQLRLFVERIERLKEEQKALGDDIRAVFSEAKANGYDVKTMRTVIRLRAMETHVRQESDALLACYREALGMTPIEKAIALSAKPASPKPGKI